MEICFTVFGNIVSHQRPRVVTTKAGQSFAYTPGKTRNWKEVIRAEAIKIKPNIPMDGELELQCIFYFLMPESKRRKDKNKEPFYCIGNKDFDNLVKSITDATQKILFRNDNQVVIGHIEKRYTEEAERVEIVIKQIIKPEYKTTINKEPELILFQN